MRGLFLGLGGLGFALTGGGGFDPFFSTGTGVGFFFLAGAEEVTEEGDCEDEAGGEPDEDGCDVAKANSSPRDSPQPAPL